MAVYLDPDTGLFISAAEAKRRGIKATKSKKAKSKKAKSRKAKSRKAASRKRKTTKAKGRKAASRKKATRKAASKRKTTKKAKSRKAATKRKATKKAKTARKAKSRKKAASKKKAPSKALKKARTATKKAKAKAKAATKKARKAESKLKKTKTQLKQAKAATRKAKAKAKKAKSRAKSKGPGRGKYQRGAIGPKSKAAAAKARKAGAPKAPKARTKAGRVSGYAGARKKDVRGHRKAGWYWTPGYMTAYANPKRDAKGRFLPKKGRKNAGDYPKEMRRAKSRQKLRRKIRRGRANPRRDAKGRFLPKRGRKNPARKPQRRKGAWKRGLPRRDARGRFLRKNAGVMGVVEDAKVTIKDLWKPVVGAGVGFFGARMAANVASVSTAVPESVQPYAPMLAQMLTGAAIWVAGSKVKALEEYKTPALVGVGLSVVEALVNRFAPETVQAYAGVPDPGLGADLDVYEAALRGYGGMGQEGLNEGWADYVPGDEELLAALEANDMLGEYVAEPMGEYVAEPLGEYVAEPMGEYVAEPMGEYVSEPMSGVEVYEAMAGGGSDSPAIGEYVAEPLSGVEVYEAMAGSPTDAEIDFYLQEAGLGTGPAPAAEGIGAYGPSPAAEGIGMFGDDLDDAADIEEELDELQDELEELEELDELDLEELGGLGLEIEALDGMGTEIDIFDQGMGGPMTDRIKAMRQRVAQRRSSRRSALARRLSEMKQRQVRSYATHIHSPIRGGGIFGDENVAGEQRAPVPRRVRIDAAALKSSIEALMPDRRVAVLTGPAKAAKLYELVKQRLGVPGSTAFRLAFREAYKDVVVRRPATPAEMAARRPVAPAPARVVAGRSPRRVPAYGGPAQPGGIRPPAGPRVTTPPQEFQDPAAGAPMMVKPLPEAPRPEPMEEITDQWAGMVGGIFHGTIFN